MGLHALPLTCRVATAKHAPAVRTAVIVKSSRAQVVAGTVLSSFVAVGSALAITSPSLSDLKKYQEQYEAATNKAQVAATQVVDQLTPSLPAVEASSDVPTPKLQPPSQVFNSGEDEGDMTPILAGLAAGIAVSGSGVALVVNNAASKVQGISPARAIDKLANEPNALLIDIRSQAEIRESGSPDLRSVKKTILTLPYSSPAPKTDRGTVRVGSFSDKFRRARKVDEESIVILLSAYTPEAQEAAKIVKDIYPDSGPVFFVTDGTEGEKGWKASGLPWREPVRFDITKSFEALKSLDLTGVASGTENIVKKYQENPTIVNGTVAAVAVAAASVFLFTEMETILELVGVYAALQFLGSKLLFADNRQKLFNDLKVLITDKIAANEAGRDLKQLASTFLEAESPEQVATLTDVPAASSNGNGATNNVAEARQWIANWRAKQRSTASVS